MISPDIHWLGASINLYLELTKHQILENPIRLVIHYCHVCLFIYFFSRHLQKILKFK